MEKLRERESENEGKGEPNLSPFGNIGVYLRRDDNIAYARRAYWLSQSVSSKQQPQRTNDTYWR